MDTRHHALTIWQLITWTISSNPYHPLNLQQGTTHTWMGKSWMVDGETMMMTMVMISSESPSRQGARTELLIPGIEIASAAERGCVSRNMMNPPMIFRSRALSSPKGNVGGRPRWPRHTWARAHPWSRPSMAWSPRAATPTPLLAPWVFRWNMTIAIKIGVFLESWLFCTKEDTRAILLKTALVRVSCIQIIQVRDQTTTKVFGKVDTSWTYQLPPSLAYCLSSSNSVDKLNAIKKNFDEHECSIWCIHTWVYDYTY